MEPCMNEIRAVVEELPGNAQEIWEKAFQEALLEVHGDMCQAAAMAWRAFKGKGQRTRQD
jgi:cation transport regulator ChaB